MCIRDRSDMHQFQQQQMANTNNLSTTASPDTKLSRPTPTRGVQFTNQSSTEPTIYVNNNNGNQQQQHQGGTSIASLSHTAPQPAKKDRSQVSLFSPAGVLDEEYDDEDQQQEPAGAMDHSIMTSFVSGGNINTNDATPPPHTEPCLLYTSPSPRDS
eukprot:TRINITY_DN29543_c0_g1_i1.p1 TRINITY_DN29543_c0_g1~~TRINITY_DN29543_c0_g1_i1.p1  ORF type:complete len:157 (-),score=47.36 TRINITY_DN29543_c0_g1_i1:113-583(-)